MLKFKNFLIILMVVLLVSSGLFLFRNFKDNKESNNTVDFSTLTMNCLGDSITYGLDVSIKDKTTALANPYPKLLKKELGLAKVRNYGVSGSTLTSVHSNRDPMSVRYREMYSQADIISVMGGVNDYWLGDIPLGNIDDTTTTTIYGALNVLVSGLKEKYSNSYIFFMTPYKWGNDTGTNALGFTLLDICNAIKDVCARNNIDVLDMYNLGQIELDFDNPNSDKLHPSQEFYEKYTAPQIAQFIKDNYK